MHGFGDRICAAGGECGRRRNLLLPQYLIQAEQEGLYRHIVAVCRAVGLGAIVYHRDNCLFELDTMRRLADACPNLIGFKDGHGNVELLTCLQETLGDRLVYVGGMPTAEIFGAANRAIGLSTYSSAIFNFIPEYAQRFYRAIHSGDRAVTSAAVRSFFIPYLALRNQCRGYAVSIIKAGLRVVGRPAGPVRAPLLDLTPDQEGVWPDWSHRPRARRRRRRSSSIRVRSQAPRWRPDLGEAFRRLPGHEDRPTRL